MIDRRHEIDDMFWLDDIPYMCGHCFQAIGAKPVWDGRSWQCDPDADTKWYLTTYIKLEREFGINFHEHFPDDLSVILEVALQDGDVIGIQAIMPPIE